MYTIHLGFSGFPIGMASVQRTLLTFKGLKLAGSTPLIVNKISHHPYTDNKKANRFDGLTYINTSYLNYKPDSFIKRNLNKISGYLGEFKFLYQKRKSIDTAILYSTYFMEYPYYFVLSRVFGFKLLIQYVEMFSAIPGRRSFFTKVNDRLIDRYICTFCDGLIVISDYLKRHARSINRVKPIIKIPANCDFNQIESVNEIQAGQYLMYCGTIHYEAVIEFIISLFVKLKQNGKYAGTLLLIISGDHQSNRIQLDKFIGQVPFKDDIIVKSNIPQAELYAAYKAADVLIIPLRNTVQDIARFPHKIGEYTAARRPVLSTNLGELNAYFQDGVSAILSDEYDVDAYYNKLLKVLPFKEKLNEIGCNGYVIGIESFDYKAQGQKLKQFIDSII